MSDAMDEREKHLRDLAEVSRAKPHFQMLTWHSAAWAVDEIDRLRALVKEADGYLNTNKLTNIGHGSILHRKFKEI